ncbi:hypothetical protein CEXT_763341, partial [Caerostris extrusa]
MVILHIKVDNSNGNPTDKVDNPN